MKAIIWPKYGAPEVLQYKDIEKPYPKLDEVLIKTYAATVTPGDCELRRFDMHVLFWLPLRIYMGVFKPKRQILGMELAGEIEAVGEEVTNFKIGDQVTAGTGLKFGAYAEYKCMKSSGFITSKPSTMSYTEAATITTGAINALHYIRKGNIQPGQKVLINGAAGCFGTYALQLAKLLGAEVTGVDSTHKLDILLELGADHVIDYTKESYTKNEISYDVILDLVGKNSVAKAMKSLTKNGRYILATPWVFQVLQGLWASMSSNRKFIFALAQEKQEDLAYLTQLIEAGKLKAIVDKNYTLKEMVAAHRYVESGDKIGHVVITVV